MSLREELISARPEAREYAASLRSLPHLAGMRGTIGDVVLFPIKALGGLKMNQGAKATDSGLTTPDGKLSDRMAMLTLKEEGELEEGHYDAVRFSQREEGILVLMKPQYDGQTLTYTAPGVPPLSITPQELKRRDGERVKVRMFKKGKKRIVEGIREDGPVTAWVQEALSKLTNQPRYAIDDVDVILPPWDFQRNVEEMHRRNQEAETLYSDGGQILVASSSTLAWMNASLRRKYGETVRGIPMEAFRPNMVLNGLPPNTEDLINYIHIGGTRERICMLFGGMSVRCDVTRVMQESGEKPDKEPLRWLKKNRPPRPDNLNSTTFGMNTVFPDTEVGKIMREGDPFIILSEKED